MTVLDCIQYVDSIEPNAYNNEQKARWIRECEGKVYTQVFLQQTFDFPDLTPWAMLGMELAVPAPYNKLYPRYLQAMIHYANGEYDRYSASMQLFNEAWSELNRWFGADYDITDRARNHRITVRIDPGSLEQKLLTVPERCAFVAGRIVVRNKLQVGEDEMLIQGNVWFGKTGKYVSQQMITMSSSYVSSGIKLLLGDIGGTDIGLTLSTEADSGEAYLTGILCIPQEQFFFGRWEQQGYSVPISDDDEE